MGSTQPTHQISFFFLSLWHFAFINTSSTHFESIMFSGP